MKKNEKPTRPARKVWKIILLILALLIAILCLLLDPDITVETLLAYTPENPALAAFVLLLLFGLKSATIFFPLIVLEITGGHLFPAGIALLINFIGISIVLTVPYWIGRISGINAIRSLIQKYPKFEEILTRQQSNSFFLCFFLRIINCLPGDVVTMYLGATKTPYLQNMAGGLLGLLPGMILATILGSNIQDPSSPAFWVSISLTAILSIASVGIYGLYRRRLRNKQSEWSREEDN